jgi:hypothetical protein
MMKRQSERPVSTFTTCSSELLGSGQCEQIAGLITPFAPDWSVELHYDEQGIAHIVVMPDDRDDDIYPTFIIYTNESGFCIDELRRDTYRKLAEHRAWNEVLRAVQIGLIWEMSVSKTGPVT